MSKAGPIPPSVLQQAKAQGQTLQSQGAEQAKTQAAQVGQLKNNAPTPGELQQRASSATPPKSVQEAGKTLQKGGVEYRGELPKSGLGELHSQKQHELAPKPTAAAQYGGVRPQATPAAQPAQARTPETQPAASTPSQATPTQATQTQATQSQRSASPQPAPSAQPRPDAAQQYGGVSKQAEPTPKPTMQPEMGG